MCLASVNVWGQETKTVTFDFSTEEGIIDMGFTPPESGKGVNITTPFTYQEITFSCTKGSEYTRIWNSKGKYTLRCYTNGGSISFEAPTDGYITNIDFEGSKYTLTKRMEIYGQGKKRKLHSTLKVLAKYKK